MEVGILIFVAIMAVLGIIDLVLRVRWERFKRDTDEWERFKRDTDDKRGGD